MTALAEPESNVEVQPAHEGSSGSSMIVFEDVGKVYDTNKVRALDGVSFVIDKGEFVFVVGASGSGKSTSSGSCSRRSSRRAGASSSGGVTSGG